MDLGGFRGSGNVEDRRGIGVGGGVGIGGLVIAVIAMFLGFDPTAVLNQAEQSSAPQQKGQVGAPQDEGGRFVSQVLESTEQVWGEIFRRSGQRYPQPKLVIFTQATRTYCGMGQAAMGPFYCPRDQTLYIDLSFYQQLRQRFQAPGDFAQAYVIAHEVGHHIQNVTGTMQQLESARARGSRAEANDTSVRVELQADCYAGVWAHHAASSIKMDAGDMEEGLRAAAAIGDDRLMQQTQGRVVPEAFTHGSSAQRQRWLRRGMETGDLKACDTFSTRNP